MTIKPPAPRPCDTCPYRRDVPAGIWHPDEYAKLARYDLPAGWQPTGVFLCHQDNGKLCGGWVGCHDMANTMSLRVAAQLGMLNLDELEETLNYLTPVALFTSGTEACVHGLSGVDDPSEEAIAAACKMLKRQRQNAIDANHN